MSDYAVVRTGGKQYRVRIGDTVTVERLVGEIGDSVNLDDVLLTSIDGEVTIGAPVLEDAAVRAEITDQPRGKKVIHFRYKNKTRQRTKRGHRQLHTDLLVQGISSGE
jgi:large subunit ribosomal protein L21